MSDTFLDPREHAIGTANQVNVHRLMSSLSVFPFSHALQYVTRRALARSGWMLILMVNGSMTNTDIQLLIAQARSEASNPAFKV